MRLRLARYPRRRSLAPLLMLASASAVSLIFFRRGHAEGAPGQTLRSSPFVSPTPPIPISRSPRGTPVEAAPLLRPVSPPRRVASPARRDYAAWGVAFVAVLLSVVSYAVTVRLGGVLLYRDARSHLEIARRVIDGTTPGLAQLGDVWLPLPHVLMLPLIWNDSLYRNGLAGTIVSMVAYVATTVLIYKITLVLTNTAFAGVAAACIFAVNVNVLYMQSTPMTELVLFAAMAATVYGIQQWAVTDRYVYLVAGGVAAFLATLSRYESWPILACLLVAVLLIAWQRGHTLEARLRLAATLDRFIIFTVVSTAGIVGWILWNWILWGDPFNFVNGPYAKPALFLTHNEPAIGHWATAAQVYWYAMAGNITWPMLALAGIGLLAFVGSHWGSKRRAAQSLPVLSFLVTVPFFIVSLYTGERPIHVMEINHGLYDVRFGLLMLIPTAVFIGHLIGSLRRFAYVMYAVGGLVLTLTLGLNFSLVRHDNVVTYIEPARYGRQPDQARVVAFLDGRYSGGRVVMESFRNEDVAFEVPSDELVYEGSYRLWLPALQHPASSDISWIIARCGSDPDQVCRSVTNAQLSGYEVVYRTPDRIYSVYRIRT